MKKLKISLVLMLFVQTAFGQVACLDTILYPQSKTTGFDLESFSTLQFKTGISQAFNANTGLIHGVRAFIMVDTNNIVGDAAPLDVYIKVFDVDGLNRPIGQAIDSALVTVNDIGKKEQTFLFTTPVAVSNRYALSITLNPLTAVLNGDKIYYMMNDPSATPPDGLNEALFTTELGDFTTNFGWFNLLRQFGSNPDYDFLIAPIFDKTIAVNYTTDVDTLCLGDDVVFSNTATLDTTYMYNRWNSLNRDPWSWSYGDGTGTYNHFDTTYTFATSGTFATQLLITNYGYTNNCVDSIQKDIEVIGAEVQVNSDTILCAGSSINLSASGTAATYTWDNGLGLGQVHTLTPTIDTLYSVTGSTTLGGFTCSNKDSVFVAIAPCNCLDTILYPQSKTTGFDLESFSTLQFKTGISQAFNANTGLIHGVRAFIMVDTNNIVGDAAPLDVYIKVFDVDGLNRPIGQAIDSALVTVNDIGKKEQTFLFTTPVAVSNRYALSITLNPLTAVLNGDKIYYMMNDPSATPPDGLNEALFTTELGDFTTNFGWFNLLRQFGSNPDYDFLIAPIFDKTIAVNYTTDVDTLCLGDDVVFSNTATLDTTYMYNRWNSLNRDPWSWSYGDGTGTYNHFDTTYTFATSGTFATQLLITNYGYTNNCVDSIQKDVEVIETVIVATLDTALCLGDTLFLSAKGALSYTWDNGLGAGQNQDTTIAMDTMFIVTGTGLFGCTDLDTVNVTINPLPTVIASNDTTVCSADTVFLSATGAVTYIWDNGLGAGQNQDTTIAMDTMFIVTGTGPLGCRGLDTVNVTINPLPTVIASNDTSVCPADTVFLSATGAVTYIWDNGLGAGQNQDTTIAMDTMFIVTGTGPLGCRGLDTVNVTINPLPSVTTSLDTAICLGDTAFLSATGAVTYIWDNGLGAGQNQDTTIATDTMFIVTGTGPLGCRGLDTVNVTINPLPTVIASNDTTVCSADTVFLSATGAVTYTWDNGLGGGQSQSAFTAIDTMYIVTGAGPLGCGDLDTVNVTVLALPAVIASNDTSVCSADTVFLSATGTVTYIWDNGLGAGQSQPALTAIDTMFIVTGTDSLGCRGLDTVNVTVLALPSVTTSLDTTICIGDTGIISATSTETVFTWDNGLGVGQSHLVSSSTDTRYIVSVTNSNNCVGRDTVQITIDGFPILASNDTSICVGSEVVLSVNGGSIYTWDNALGFGELHIVSPEVTTTYIVTSDENGCIYTDTVVVTIENTCFEVPNVFTPNGDGKNDIWNIRGLDSYPDVRVKVFNRWGDSVFESDAGYTYPWDGTYNGKNLPSGTYYYIIALGNGEAVSSGTINIVK